MLEWYTHEAVPTTGSQAFTNGPGMYWARMPESFAWRRRFPRQKL
jgi:hypothetical protein